MADGFNPTSPSGTAPPPVDGNKPLGTSGVAPTEVSGDPTKLGPIKDSSQRV